MAANNRRGETNGSPRTIKTQLLVAVNGSLAVVVAVVLVYDYRRGFDERLEEKRVALEEEAKTLLPAVLEVSPQGTGAVQSYIDTVCAQMQDSQSPGHHIAVELDGQTLQAVAHHRASPEILQAEEYSATVDRTATEAAEHIRVALEEFRQNHPRHDDVTLVVVDFCD